MYANLPYIARIERARRNEAERKAAHWRSIRTPYAPSRPKQVFSRLGRHLCLLSRIRERQIVRTRLREYATR